MGAVSWNDVTSFCKKLTERERKAGRLPDGWEYALPTEAQWEYACRAGTTTVYSWGNSIAASNANYSHHYSPLPTPHKDVGQYEANPWGFFDMHGHVVEWTADWYQAAYPANHLPSFNAGPVGTVTDPEGPASGAARVVRGGSWYSSKWNCRSAARGNYTPRSIANYLGFRVGFKAEREKASAKTKD